MPFVYRLKHPVTGVIGYVGITSDLYTRYKKHITTSNVNKWKEDWIGAMRKEGLIPSIEVIETHESWEKAAEREKYWIRYYVGQGVQLYNIDFNDGPPIPLSPFKPDPGLEKILSYYSDHKRFTYQAEFMDIEPIEIEEKPTYTIKELIDNLVLTPEELGTKLHISEFAVRRIYEGEAGKYIGRVELLLLHLSRIYQRSLTLENVTGITS